MPSILDLARMAEESARPQREADAAVAAQQTEDALVNAWTQRCLDCAKLGIRDVQARGKDGDAWIKRIQVMGFTTVFTTQYNEPYRDSLVGVIGGDTDYYVTLGGWDQATHQPRGSLKDCCEAYSVARKIILRRVKDGPLQQAQVDILSAAAKGVKSVAFGLQEKAYPSCLSPDSEVLVQLLEAEGLRVEVFKDNRPSITISGW